MRLSIQLKDSKILSFNLMIVKSCVILNMMFAFRCTWCVNSGISKIFFRANPFEGVKICNICLLVLHSNPLAIKATR